MGTHAFCATRVSVYIHTCVLTRAGTRGPGRLRHSLCLCSWNWHSLLWRSWDDYLQYMCVCVWEIECGKRRKNWEWEALGYEVPGRVPLDSWIPSPTMSTIENVVLERHIEDLTRITCNRNIQNIPILLHSHESFSTCVATNKTSEITAWVVKHWELQ